MRQYFRVILLVGALAVAGCACNRSPEVLPVGSVPLTNGYATAVTPAAKVVTPAPQKRTYTRKAVYKKKRPAARKTTVKKVKKPVTRKRAVVRRPAPQPVPPIPMPLEEVREAGRIPERLQ